MAVIPLGATALQPHAVIVGGGIAGLAAAYELEQRRVPFLLFEARQRAGGVVFSESVDGGYHVDAGPDSLLTQKPEGVALCHELGLADRLIPTLPPRTAYIQRDHQLIALPAGSVLGIPTRLLPFAASKLFSWRGKVRMAGEIFVPPARTSDDESVGAFMRRRFGTEATTYLAEPLLAGIHAGDVERLSLGALFPRLRDAEQSCGSVLRSLRRRSRARGLEDTPSGRASSEAAFRSLPGGLGELVDALVRSLPHDRLRLGAAVARIERAGGRFHVETESGIGVTTSAVVLASPAFVTAGLVRGISPRLCSLCGQIPYASTATVVFAFVREAVGHPLAGTGFVVPKVERTGILAASWLSSKWAHRAPPGHVLVRAFIGGARDPQALDCSDEELTERALAALRPLLVIRDAPLWARVYRWPRANAQHEVGHHARLAEIEAELAQHPGLYVTGSAYRGVGIPDCVADGRATARQVTAWLSRPEVQP